MKNNFNRIRGNVNNIIVYAITLCILVIVYYALQYYDISILELPSRLFKYLLGLESDINTVTASGNVALKIPGNQVFNIKNNVYTYDEAKLACKALNSELATLEQVMDAYKSGANWCNYGWSQEQLALYPTQRSYWKSLQKNTRKKHQCGYPGVNGGYFKNTNLKFGANCYGPKPEPLEHERIKTDITELHDNLFNMNMYLNREDIQILPFNDKKWSEK